MWRLKSQADSEGVWARWAALRRGSCATRAASPASNEGGLRDAADRATRRGRARTRAAAVGRSLACCAGLRTGRDRVRARRKERRARRHGSARKAPAGLRGAGARLRARRGARAQPRRRPPPAGARGARAAATLGAPGGRAAARASSTRGAGARRPTHAARASRPGGRRERGRALESDRHPAAGDGHSRGDAADGQSPDVRLPEEPQSALRRPHGAEHRDGVPVEPVE